MFRQFILKLSFLILTSISFEAVACEHRQEFFRATDDGTLAFVSNANNESDARSLYSGWCRVVEGSIARRTGDRAYFALNNRTDQGGEPRYYIVKVFRRSRATELRPLLSLRRSGTWVNSRCAPLVGEKINPKLFKYNRRGRTAVTLFLDNVRNSNLNDQICSPFERWSGSAFAVEQLSLQEETRFLLKTPERVQSTGIEKWSLAVTAFSFGTVPLSDRSSRFPVLRVKRDGADEIIIQYISSGSKFHEFTLTS